MIQYISTRGGGNPISSAEAIIKGIAEDGGLFVPTEIPKIPRNFINQLCEGDYEFRAENVLGQFLTDYTDTEITTCVARAYGGSRFDNPRRAPLRVIGDSFSVLELWHGPTSAFKDMALQILPHLLNKAMKKLDEKNQIMILVATSGDTGKAALEGFANVRGIKILVFYPDGGVSKIQRLQMVTQVGKNVEVIGVNGNFDDAQNGVKKIFNDRDFNSKLENLGVKLSSANSINWGRLVPQIVYYFSAYADLLARQKIQNGEEINFCVPTGNFGNILAAYYAKRMGLPIHKLICASNRNDVLTDFFKTGKYDRNREFFKTISPSMDILISSNLERLLYHETGDSARVKKFMEDLSTTGSYEIDSELHEKLKSIFWADFAAEDETLDTIQPSHGTLRRNIKIRLEIIARLSLYQLQAHINFRRASCKLSENVSMIWMNLKCSSVCMKSVKSRFQNISSIFNLPLKFILRSARKMKWNSALKDLRILDTRRVCD